MEFPAESIEVGKLSFVFFGQRCWDGAGKRHMGAMRIIVLAEMRQFLFQVAGPVSSHKRSVSSACGSLLTVDVNYQ
jgi:hypothetical protein